MGAIPSQNGEAKSNLSTELWQIGQRVNQTFDLSYGIEDPSDGHISESSSNVKLKILTNGNIGIGTLFPSSKLEVNGTATISDQIIKMGSEGFYKINDFGQVMMQHLNNDNGTEKLWQTGQRSDGSFDISYGGFGMDFVPNTSSNVKIKIDTTGNVGIGTLMPDTKLKVKGTATVTEQIIKDGGDGFFKINDLGQVMMQNINNENGTEKIWQAGQRTDGSFDISYGGFGMDFVINNSSNVKIKIDTTGRVGIGTLTPDADLEAVGEVLLGTSTLLVSGAQDRIGINETSPDANLYIKMTEGNLPGLSIENDGNTNTWSFGIASNDLLIRFNGITVGSFDDASGIYSPSDFRLKNSIEPLENNILNKISQLKPSKYYYNHTSNNSRKEYGFIAQDVAEVFPEIVTQREESEFLMLKYSDFNPLLTAAIQEQQNLIDRQSSDIQMLKEMNRELIDELSSMEERLKKLEE